MSRQAQRPRSATATSGGLKLRLALRLEGK